MSKHTSGEAVAGRDQRAASGWFGLSFPCESPGFNLGLLVSSSLFPRRSKSATSHLLPLGNKQNQTPSGPRELVTKLRITESLMWGELGVGGPARFLRGGSKDAGFRSTSSSLTWMPCSFGHEVDFALGARSAQGESASNPPEGWPLGGLPPPALPEASAPERAVPPISAAPRLGAPTRLPLCATGY